MFLLINILKWSCPKQQITANRKQTSVNMNSKTFGECILTPSTIITSCYLVYSPKLKIQQHPIWKAWLAIMPSTVRETEISIGETRLNVISETDLASTDAQSKKPSQRHTDQPTAVSDHFTLSAHSMDNIELDPLELITSNRDAIRKTRETFLISKGKTVEHRGLNRCNGIKSSYLYVSA